MSRSITIETGSDAAPQPASASDSTAQGGDARQESPLADLMITFRKGSAELSPDSIGRAKQFAEALKDPRVANTRIEIAGHTDMSGSERTNQILSQRRADSVVEFLVEQGVQPSRVTGRGYGSTKLRYPDQPYSPKNRRVEARPLS